MKQKHYIFETDISGKWRRLPSTYTFTQMKCEVKLSKKFYAKHNCKWPFRIIEISEKLVDENALCKLIES